jgi:hypothetical protein
MVLSSNSDENEVPADCQALMMISLSGINEAGRSIVESSEGTRTTSIAECTALPSGFDKIQIAKHQKVAFLIPDVARGPRALASREKVSIKPYRR